MGNKKVKSYSDSDSDSYSDSDSDSDYNFFHLPKIHPSRNLFNLIKIELYEKQCEEYEKEIELYKKRCEEYEKELKKKLIKEQREYENQQRQPNVAYYMDDFLNMENIKFSMYKII